MSDVTDQRAIPPGLQRFLDDGAVALTLADMELPDSPLVAANDSFYRFCGYSAGEVLGRNCRFLQPQAGAGPVTKRIRTFLRAEGSQQDRFLIPNVRKDGSSFLNLLYLAKLRSKTGRQFVLGSQFNASTGWTNELDTYERALGEDIKRLNQLTNAHGWMILGSFDALASSHALIAQLRLDD